jgi:hypothetical protein
VILTALAPRHNSEVTVRTRVVSPSRVNKPLVVTMTCDLRRRNRRAGYRSRRQDLTMFHDSSPPVRPAMR